MGLTQAAPGHNGARVARGDTLEHGGLVHSQGEVLRPHEDRRLLVGPRARAWEEDATLPHCSWDPSHLLTTLLPYPHTQLRPWRVGDKLQPQTRYGGWREEMLAVPGHYHTHLSGHGLSRWDSHPHPNT